MSIHIDDAIAEDLAAKRRCFAYGRTPLGGCDMVRPDPRVGVKDGKVALRDIDGGHRGYWVTVEEYFELRKFPMRHVGIWQFVREDDEAADDVAWAISNPESAGRRIHRLEKELAALKKRESVVHG